MRRTSPDEVPGELQAAHGDALSATTKKPFGPSATSRISRRFVWQAGAQRDQPRVMTMTPTPGAEGHYYEAALAPQP